MRDYQKENRNYKSKDNEKKKRAGRNYARRLMMRLGKVHKGDGKHVDHKDGNPLNNKKSNLTVKSASKNSSYPRTKSARKRNPKS
jgi:hypothetical protein